MLVEIAVAQKEKNIFRRWFQDENFELIVWYDMKTMLIHGFQLCYDISKDEHSLTWIEDKGFTHNKIDEGSRPLRHPSTPILIADGMFSAEIVLGKFIESSKSIDDAVTKIVISKIREFGTLNTHDGDRDIPPGKNI